MASLKGPVSVFHLTGAVEAAVPSGSVAVGLETFDGNGGLTGSVERNNQGVITVGTSLSGTYALDSNGLGRGQLNFNGRFAAKTLLYMVSPGRAFLIDSGGYEAGMLEPQNAANCLPADRFSATSAIGALSWRNWKHRSYGGRSSANGVGGAQGNRRQPWKHRKRF